jgi:tetratricopeptide (TPR) repeat protein
MQNYVRIMALAVGVMTLTFCVSVQPKHPAYLHALSDLRAARWMIEHRPGDWASTVDEVEAVRQIDGAINDIKKAAIDDGKNIDWHPTVDELPDHTGRLHEALDFLKRAHSDVAQEEDNYYASGLRGRAIGHIDAAVRATRRALNE